jgi:hypothetical protein
MDRDRKYEHDEAKRENTEWDEYEKRKEAAIKATIASMSQEELVMMGKLNEDLHAARNNYYHIKNQLRFQKDVSDLLLLEYATLRSAYRNAKKEFNRAAEKWPVLIDGY